MNITYHAQARLQQRCIDIALVNLLIDYGHCDDKRGIGVFWINKRYRKAKKQQL